MHTSCINLVQARFLSVSLLECCFCTACLLFLFCKLLSEVKSTPMISRAIFTNVLRHDHFLVKYKGKCDISWNIQLRMIYSYKEMSNNVHHQRKVPSHLLIYIMWSRSFQCPSILGSPLQTNCPGPLMYARFTTVQIQPLAFWGGTFAAALPNLKKLRTLR